MNLKGVTGLRLEALAELGEKTGRSREDAAASLAGQQPTGRLIAPSEVADTVAFLIADSGQITGQGINIDGGKVQS